MKQQESNQSDHLFSMVIFNDLFSMLPHIALLLFVLIFIMTSSILTDAWATRQASGSQRTMDFTFQSMANCLGIVVFTAFMCTVDFGSKKICFKASLTNIYQVFVCLAIAAPVVYIQTMDLKVFGVNPNAWYDNDVLRAALPAAIFVFYSARGFAFLFKYPTPFGLTSSTKFPRSYTFLWVTFSVLMVGFSIYFHLFLEENSGNNNEYIHFWIVTMYYCIWFHDSKTLKHWNSLTMDGETTSTTNYIREDIMHRIVFWSACVLLSTYMIEGVALLPPLSPSGNAICKNHVYAVVIAAYGVRDITVENWTHTMKIVFWIVLSLIYSPLLYYDPARRDFFLFIAVAMACTDFRWSNIRTHCNAKKHEENITGPFVYLSKKEKIHKLRDMFLTQESKKETTENPESNDTLTTEKKYVKKNFDPEQKEALVQKVADILLEWDQEEKRNKVGWLQNLLTGTPVQSQPQLKCEECREYAKRYAKEE